MKKKYYFASIMMRLEKAIQYPVDFRNLQILIYGWRVKNHLPGYDLSQDSE